MSESQGTVLEPAEVNGKSNGCARTCSLAFSWRIRYDRTSRTLGSWIKARSIEFRNAVIGYSSLYGDLSCTDQGAPPASFFHLVSFGKFPGLLSRMKISSRAGFLKKCLKTADMSDLFNTTLHFLFCFFCHQKYKNVLIFSSSSHITWCRRLGQCPVGFQSSRNPGAV